MRRRMINHSTIYVFWWNVYEYSFMDIDGFEDWTYNERKMKGRNIRLK